MKVTSFEISKKLAEIGFEVLESEYEDQRIVYEPDDLYRKRCEEYESEIVEVEDLIFGGPSKSYYLAYDLEIILDTLPYSIKRNDFEYTLSLNQYVAAYIEDCGGDDLCGSIREKEESMADCAANLLLKLVEKGILNFNKSEEGKGNERKITREN